MDVSDVLEAISQLLQACDHDEGEPTWLRQRAKELRSAPSEKQRRKIPLQIKGVIAGMGSLTDIYLDPPATLGLSKVEANTRLRSLARELDRQVRTALQW